MSHGSADILAQVKGCPEALARLSGAARIALSTHKGPDADGLASALAMAEALRGLGKQTTVVTQDMPPPRFRFLDDRGEIRVLGRHPEAETALVHADIVVLLDSADLPASSKLSRLAHRGGATLLIVDHHLSRQVPLGIVVPDCSSTGELTYWILDALGAPISQRTAEWLYAAMSYDTLSFRFLRNQAQTLRVAAHLIELGADATRIQEHLYQSQTRDGLTLLGNTLQTVRSELGGAFVYAVITPSMRRGLRLERDDYRDVIQHLISISGVAVAVLLQGDEQSGEIKVSLRSKAGVDVEPIARRFGGGGHAQACGATVRKSRLDVVLDELRREVAAVVEASRLS